MATVAQLDVVINAETSGLQKGLAQSTSIMDKLRTNLLQAGLAMSAAFTAPIVALGKLGIEFNAMKETATVAFTNMLGGAEKARDMFQSLVEFAAKTPFVIRDLVPATQKLLAAGIAAEKIIPTLKAIGDAASASGRGQEGIDRITNALIQMKNKGKVSAEEMIQQLGEIVPAMQIVAEGMGISTAELGERMKKGLLDVDKTIAILIEGFNKRFGGMMEEQSKTFTGALSNIADTVNSTLGSILEPLFNRLRDILLAIVPALSELQKWFQSLSPEVQNAGIAFAAVLAVAGPVALAIAGIAAAISAIGVPIAAAVVAVGALAAAYASNFGGIRDLVNATVQAITEWFNTHKEDLLALGKKVQEIAGIYADAMGAMTRAVTALVQSVQKDNKDHADSWDFLFKTVLKVADLFVTEFKMKMLQNTIIFIILTEAAQKWVKDIQHQFALIKLAVKVVEVAFKDIYESIVGPFRRALEWLNQNVSRFRAAFDAITAAAKAGLVVKSPPIAAQWLVMIGEAAAEAAAKTAKTAPQFGAAMGVISSAAKLHLPAVISEWVRLGETVIGVLEKLKVVVPKAVKDIFGAVTGAGSGAGTAATGILGKIGTFFGGIFNIAGAIDGIIKSIRSIFGIKSAFQKAMEAEQVAQARLQTQQMKLDIERTAQEVIQAAVSSFQKALEFFDQLDAFTPARKVKFQQFFANLTRLMKHFLELAQSWSITSLAQAKAAAETVGPVVEAISGLPDAFEAINGHFGIAQSAIDRFFADFSKVMDAFFARSEVWIDGISKRAMKVANRLSPVVELISAFGTAMSDITDVKEPSDEMFAIFDRVIDKIVTHVANLSLKFDKAVLKTMANFAEKAGAALAIWKEAIESIRATVDVPTPSEGDVDNVVAGIELFVAKLSAAVERLITTDLARVTAFANTIAPIAAAIKAWAETAEVVRGYTAIAADVWEQIVSDFERGLVLLNLLILDAQLYVDKATTFKSLIDQGSSLIEAALGAFGSSISAASSALTGSLPQGGTALGSATAASFGVSSAQSTVATQSSGSIVFQPGSIVVQGSVIEEIGLADVILQKLVDLQRAGRIGLITP